MSLKNAAVVAAGEVRGKESLDQMQVCLDCCGQRRGNFDMRD